MYVALDEVKAYMRVEYPEEDALITSLILAAEEDAKSFINIDVLEDVKNSAMIKLAIKHLVSHWFENRTAVSVTTASAREMPLSVQRLLERERGVPI